MWFLMVLDVDNVKKRITADLIHYGHFLNYIDAKLLKNAIGDVLRIDIKEEESAEVKGILLGMKMTYFFPTKQLIMFIRLKEGQKMLLRVFLNTIRERFQISTNWQIILVPFKGEGDSLELYNLAKFFSDLRFIDYCRSEGVKIIDEYMLTDQYFDPIEISNDNKHSIKLVKKLFSPINRNDYIESQNLLREILKSETKNIAIIKTTLAQFIFSTIEAWDYYQTLDVIDKINPYYVFKRYLEKEKKINRKDLRNFVNNTFLKLMRNFDPRSNQNQQGILKKSLNKYNINEQLKNNLINAFKALFEISELKEIIKYLEDWKVFPTNE